MLLSRRTFLSVEKFNFYKILLFRQSKNSPFGKQEVSEEELHHVLNQVDLRLNGQTDLTEFIQVDRRDAKSCVFKSNAIAFSASIRWFKIRDIL